MQFQYLQNVLQIKMRPIGFDALNEPRLLKQSFQFDDDSMSLIT